MYVHIHIHTHTHWFADKRRSGQTGGKKQASLVLTWSSQSTSYDAVKRLKQCKAKTTCTQPRQTTLHHLAAESTRLVHRLLLIPSTSLAFFPFMFFSPFHSLVCLNFTLFISTDSYKPPLDRDLCWGFCFTRPLSWSGKNPVQRRFMGNLTPGWDHQGHTQGEAWPVAHLPFELNCQRSGTGHPW